MRRTRWFPACMNPVHVGVYETLVGTLYTRTGGYSYWNGKRWSNEMRTAAEAYEKRDMAPESAMPWKVWRGIAAKADQ